VLISPEAFTLLDPESVKKIDNLTVNFMHLGSAHVKAAHKTLMKWTPGVNFINILRAAFIRGDPESVQKIDNFNLTVIFTHLGSAHIKAAHKTLMKLTPGFVIMKFYVEAINILKMHVNSKIL